MSSQKPKTVLQNLGAKLNIKLIAWHGLSLSLGTPVAIGLIVSGLVLYIQPITMHAQGHAQKPSNKTATHHVTTPAKATQSVAVAPKPVAPPPTSPPPAPAKSPIQAGTPKPEPVVTPSPSSSVSGLAPTTPAPPAPSTQAPSSQNTTTGYTSTNWSGYLATNGTFTAVFGSWNATRATGNGTSISADSTWIGIGGVTSGDLIQVGTQNIIAANGQVSTSAFYELLPDYAQVIPSITVSQGDNMTASIYQLSVGQWTIVITDTTNGQSYTINVAYASSLSSAEWIEEDPSFSFRRQIPFDNFQVTYFMGGSTTANGITQNIATSTAQPVIMVNLSGQAVAVPSVIGGDGASFTVSP